MYILGNVTSSLSCFRTSCARDTPLDTLSCYHLRLKTLKLPISMNDLDISLAKTAANVLSRKLDDKESSLKADEDHHALEDVTIALLNKTTASHQVHTDTDTESDTDTDSETRSLTTNMEYLDEQQEADDGQEVPADD